MNTLGPYFFPAFILMALTWGGLSAFVILRRASYDRQHRAVRTAQIRLRENIVVSKEGDIQVLDAVLAEIPESVIAEIAADSITPKWQAEILSGYLLQRGGTRRITRLASSHHGPKGKRSRIAALRILTLGGDTGALPLLEQALRDKDADVVAAAIAALGGVHDEAAASLLIEALQTNRYAPSRIATQLDRFSLPIEHLLLPLLRHPIPVVRFWGATLLSRYAGAEISAALVSLRNDSDAGVRKAMVETLGKVGGPESVETAIALLNDPVWFVRAHAARAIGDLQRVDLCDLVTPLLRDREWWVRTAAKDALEAMGPDVMDHLIPVLSSSDRFARNSAAEVLQNLGILDALVAETIHMAVEEPERIDLISRILAAGGPELIRVAVDRAGATHALAATRLIQKATDRYGVAA